MSLLQVVSPSPSGATLFYGCCRVVYRLVLGGRPPSQTTPNDTHLADVQATPSLSKEGNVYCAD